MNEHQAEPTGMGKKEEPAAVPPPGRKSVDPPSQANRLDVALQGAANLADAKAILRRQMRLLWPKTEVFFAFVDPAHPRFLLLRDDGRYVPKPGRVFALDHFLTRPDSPHSYSEHTVKDLEVLGRLAAYATRHGLPIHSLAVPVHRKGLLRGAIGFFSERPFDWDETDVGQLGEMGEVFLKAIDAVRRTETRSGAAPVAVGAGGKGRGEGETDLLQDRLAVHAVISRIAASLPQSLDLVAACCEELAAFFKNVRFTIGVHYPESRLFVIHGGEQEPRRVASDETMEGYFLHRTDEDVLVVEDYALWSPPAPLHVGASERESQDRSGVFAAARIQGTLVAVISLRASKPVAWEAREIDLLRDIACDFGLVYYHAMVCDSLTESCREAHGKLEETRRDAQIWHRRAEHMQQAAALVRAIPPCATIADFVREMHATLVRHCPDFRFTIERYLPEAKAFEVYPAASEENAGVRPTRHCIQHLFLNNVPVTQILCDSPEEIAYYEELDPRLVALCEKEGFRGFCSVPVFVGPRFWGTITCLSREPGGCGTHCELLAEIGRAVALPIQAAEDREMTPHEPGVAECRRDAHQMVRNAEAPMALIDLASGKILQANARFAECLTTAEQDLRGSVLESLATDDAGRAAIRQLRERIGQRIVTRLEKVSLRRPAAQPLEAAIHATCLPGGTFLAMVLATEPSDRSTDS